MQPVSNRRSTDNSAGNASAQPTTRLTLRKFIGIFDSAKADFLPALNPTHGLHDAAQEILIRKLDSNIWVNAGATGDLTDISRGVVLACWRPAVNDARNGIDGRAFVQIAAQDNEACTEPHFHAGELLEGGVGLRVAFALPIVASTNVKWVVVSDSSGCHRF